jgi:hypothetical protein
VRKIEPDSNLESNWWGEWFFYHGVMRREGLIEEVALGRSPACKDLGKNVLSTENHRSKVPEIGANWATLEAQCGCRVLRDK